NPEEARRGYGGPAYRRAEGEICKSAAGIQRRAGHAEERSRCSISGCGETDGANAQRDAEEAVSRDPAKSRLGRPARRRAGGLALAEASGIATEFGAIVMSLTRGLRIALLPVIVEL